jgi:hypothetical protein
MYSIKSGKMNFSIAWRKITIGAITLYNLCEKPTVKCGWGREGVVTASQLLTFQDEAAEGRA